MHKAKWCTPVYLALVRLVSCCGKCNRASTGLSKLGPLGECVAGALTDAVSVLLSRGQAAVEMIAAAPDPTSRKDADAFQQLQLVRQVVELAGQRQWDKVLQVRHW